MWGLLEWRSRASQQTGQGASGSVREQEGRSRSRGLCWLSGWNSGQEVLHWRETEGAGTILCHLQQTVSYPKPGAKSFTSSSDKQAQPAFGHRRSRSLRCERGVAQHPSAVRGGAAAPQSRAASPRAIRRLSRPLAAPSQTALGAVPVFLTETWRHAVRVGPRCRSLKPSKRITLLIIALERCSYSTASRTASAARFAFVSSHMWLCVCFITPTAHDKHRGTDVSSNTSLQTPASALRASFPAPLPNGYPAPRCPSGPGRPGRGRLRPGRGVTRRHWSAALGTAPGRPRAGLGAPHPPAPTLRRRSAAARRGEGGAEPRACAAGGGAEYGGAGPWEAGEEAAVGSWDAV